MPSAYFQSVYATNGQEGIKFGHWDRAQKAQGMMPLCNTEDITVNLELLSLNMQKRLGGHGGGEGMHPTTTLPVETYM